MNDNQNGREPTAEEKEKIRCIIMSQDDFGTLEQMIKVNGIDINAELWDLTALHYAVFNNKLKSVKKLIELGADISVTDFYNDTPLDLAVKKNNADIVRFFIKECDQDTSAIQQRNQSKIKSMMENTGD